MWMLTNLRYRTILTYVFKTLDRSRRRFNRIRNLARKTIALDINGDKVIKIGTTMTSTSTTTPTTSVNFLLRADIPLTIWISIKMNSQPSVTFNCLMTYLASFTTIVRYAFRWKNKTFGKTSRNIYNNITFPF